jgi:hypothetical protein
MKAHKGEATRVMGGLRAGLMIAHMRAYWFATELSAPNRSSFAAQATVSPSPASKSAA